MVNEVWSGDENKMQQKKKKTSFNFMRISLVLTIKIHLQTKRGKQ